MYQHKVSSVDTVWCFQCSAAKMNEIFHDFEFTDLFFPSVKSSVVIMFDFFFFTSAVFFTEQDIFQRRSFTFCADDSAALQKHSHWRSPNIVCVVENEQNLFYSVNPWHAKQLPARQARHVTHIRIK